MIDITFIISQLENDAVVFKSLFLNISKHQARWKPNEDTWSILEIVNHLHDEEEEDFRARVFHCLENPSDLQPPSIDPESRIKEREYNSRDFSDSMAKFLNERAISIDLLNGLDAPDWSRYYTHPRLGNLTASYFMHNWLAHDYHHIRQINNLKYLYLKYHAKVENLRYAGEW